ncbi:MAG: amino acid permease [Spirochaetes bacterium]|nr:amino acid permease [Spirochaetota bacterium]
MIGNIKIAEKIRTLGAMEVFSIASGAMISSGLFVLPAVVFRISGPAIIIGYFLASLLMLPALFSKIELATAMPKSGGTYFFIYRSCGSFFGTFAGFASWFSVSLKSAFALLGIGVFLSSVTPFIGEDQSKYVAIILAVFFTTLNSVSVEKSGKFQVYLVIYLLLAIIFFFIFGIEHVDVHKYSPFMKGGLSDLLKVTGMVFISYGGLTKVAAIAEEIKDPVNTIKKSMFSAFIIVSLLYITTIFILVGVLTESEIISTYAPISVAAGKFSGKTGFYILSAAAITAFITTAHAGILAASRNPLAMAKDNLIPSILSKINMKFNTPANAIFLTFVFITSSILFFDLEHLVKAASTMMLILFTLVNLSVIIMRESRISSYKPTFKSPFYPYIQITGIILYILLIINMGFYNLITTAVFTAGCILWYFIYSKRREHKNSALIHIVERITSKEIKTSTLPDELRSILFERDSIVEDRFDKIIYETEIIDITSEIDSSKLFKILAKKFSEQFNEDEKELLKLFQERENESTTVLSKGLAIPHIIVPGENSFGILVVRSKLGIKFPGNSDPVKIVFALAGSKDERTFHLQSLMSIAQIIKNKNFIENWMKANNTRSLKNLILLAERVRTDKI